MKRYVLIVAVALVVALSPLLASAAPTPEGKGWAKNCFTAIWC